MDQLAEVFGLPYPNYIKIDVPGMSEAILAGGVRTLRHPELREIHVEVDEEFHALTALLAEAGFEASTHHAHRRSSDVTFIRRP